MTNLNLKNIVLASSFITLTACGGGGGGETPPANDPVVSLITSDSKSIDLASTDLQGEISTACYTNNSNGVIETVSISDTTWTYKVNTYTADSTCSNTPTTTTAVATLTIGDIQNVGKWVDGSSVLTNPPLYAGDSSMLLPTDSPYTVISGVVNSSTHPDISVGMTFSTGYVIDNSSADGVVLYRVKNTSTGETTVVDSFTDIPASPSSSGGGSSSSGGADIRVTINSVVNTGYDSSKITYTVTNFGDTATGLFQVMGWANRASAPDYGSAQSGKFQYHTNLAANGGSEVGVITVDATTMTPGAALNAYVIADYAQEVGETDEGLTGTSDNLAHKAWAVKDIVVFEGVNFIEKLNSVQVMAAYESNTATRISMSSNGDISAGLQIVLSGEVVPGTYTLAGGDVFQAIAGFSSTTYGYHPIYPAVTPVTVTINQAGAVGELVSGTYSAQLCSNNGPSSCIGTLKTFTGSFSMIRDANR